MKHGVILGVMAAMFALPLAATALPKPKCSVEVKGGADPENALVSFLGPISPERVETFIRAIDPKGATKLVINSSGGDGAAGLKFGRWVWEHKLDVEVQGLCVSACANYVFPAGQKKIICPGSLVLWHGSMEQKDVRALVNQYEGMLLRIYTGPSPVTEVERQFLEDKRLHFNSARELRELQGRLYDDLQVNEYITRLGQEPVDFGIDMWTVTPRVMQRFGILNVDAPEGYGTLAYMRKSPVGPFLLGGRYLTFDLDNQERVTRVVP
ncbi:hypothetical protein [Usitatibacter palustris]|uniref:Clp protease n=1 Tax=Usitatibacter palustris TaxID=2732487 RepID=A0A6M4HAL8_9PROT|nr:hypothetical protein [Usitatibacter palustris]QJR15087.1 hypothetical protein DSM104440_01903 [Usitatibacter palustris]